MSVLFLFGNYQLWATRWLQLVSGLKNDRNQKGNQSRTKFVLLGFMLFFSAFLVFVRLGCLVKAFRKKLTKRPLALRCQTQYIQAHDFGDVVMRYLDCPKDSFAWKLRQLLTDGSVAIDPAVGQFWHELIGDSPPCLSKEIQRAAFAILWMGLRCCLPKPKLASSREAARSTFLLCLKMNRWCSLRKLMLGLQLPSPGLEHLCMVLGMSGQAMPTSIFMIANSPVHRQMRHSLICSNRTVACLVRTSLPQQLWRPCKIMSLIITRYVAYISLLLTCGGHGSTILPGPERLLTNFGVFLIMMTYAV